MVRGAIEKSTALVLAGLILLFSLASVFYGGPECIAIGVFRGASWLSRLGYSFFHASFLHASLNAWCFLSIIFIYEVSWRRLLMAYLIAVCVPDFILSPSFCPTVGLSAVCFALFGLIAFSVRRKLYYHFCMALYIFFGFLFPFVNGWIHLYSYLAGLLVGLLVMPIPCRRRSARK